MKTLNLMDVFQLNPSGYGCWCAACERRFSTSGDFHGHLARCTGNTHREVQPEKQSPAPAQQLEIEDWRSPK